MTLKSRIEKLTSKLKPEVTKIYYLGWKDCTWSESGEIKRGVNESQEDFRSRVRKATRKQFLWFK